MARPLHMGGHTLEPPMRTSPIFLLPLAACGVDSATANGELGRMEFTLVSDYYLSEHDLGESNLVTGHEQVFSVGLTGAGEEDAKGAADEVEYVVVPDDGVTLSQSGPDDDSGEDDPDADLPPGFSLEVTEPGDYQIEARLDGETFDRITLSFDTPQSLELSLYAREPWAEEFAKLDGEGPFTVEEGAQLAWLPIPLGGDGERLLGDIESSMSADPAEAVVPAANVEHVNEDEVQTFFRADSLYFIEAGELTVTVSDTVNPAAAAVSFTVE